MFITSSWSTVSVTTIGLTPIADTQPQADGKKYNFYPKYQQRMELGQFSVRDRCRSMTTPNDGSWKPLRAQRVAYAVLAMNTEQPPQLAYKLKDAAALLGVSTVTMRRAIQRGLIRPSRAFRHVLISADELNRFLKSTSAIKQC